MSKSFKFFLFLLFGLVLMSFFLIRVRFSSDLDSGFFSELSKKYCMLRGGEEIEIGCGIARCTYKCSLSF
ncbi:MAG: hypothetical protein AUJ23_01540 [Candidatus Magasanikbacteria bacterium CG1_02_32_51]|uniref:Uncharacterized protein n=1 Tax=Candidatus Magasanikbacteria bacterium CG1_02_32_51 TaxID=1805238 RepID=A0A1J4U8X7_9BACT|nr:MAG: hypothetical protein AUJ23_01540 [Candidatus Magasanikbacteria bacterium CG1_02_32_51]